MKIRHQYLISTNLRTSLILAAFILFSISCKKDHNILGADVQDETDVLNAHFSDTATIFAHTVKIDSVASFNDAIKFIGSNQDPVFGRTDVSLFTKFSLLDNRVNVSFGEDANLVSSEIVLAVKSLDFVGDYLTPLTYQVFEMNQTISSDVLCYTAQKNWYNSNNLLGTFTGTVDVMNGTLVIRIPVNSVYAASVLNNPQFLLNNDVFQTTYKGFYITTKSTNLNPVGAQGAITRIDLDNSLSGFYLYYQNGTITASKETKSYKMPFSGANVERFNQVQYNYLNGSSNLLSKQMQGDTVAGAQGLFLKGLGGSRVKLQIPFLTNYVAKKKIAINKAEIIFKVDQGLNGNDGKYIPPLKLAILGIDSLSREIYTFDQLSSIDFIRYGGVYDSDNKQYVFNISRDIQAIMNGKRKNLGFYMVVADGDRAYTIRRDDRSERVVLGGTGSTLYKPVIKLTYIPFEND